MDEMGHVNNAVYLTYFEQARIGYLHHVCAWNWQETGVILASAHVDYLRPLIYSQPACIAVRVSKMGNKSFDISYLITAVIEGKELFMTTGYTTMVVFDYQNNRSVSIPTELREQIHQFESKNL